MTEPTVTVLMSVYNGESHLAEAVESILVQTFSDFEFVVVDDGSTDRTAAVLDGYRDSRMVRVNHERNMGLVAALNRGLESGRGRWIARMDADDVSKPERLEKQMAFLAGHPDVDVVGCRMDEIDEKGNGAGVFWAPEASALIAWKMLFETAMAHATTVMRKTVLVHAGGYNPDYRHVEDVELWSRLWGRVRFANLPDALYVRRRHRKSICSTEGPRQTAMARAIRAAMWERLLGRQAKQEWLAWIDEGEWPVLTRPQMNELAAAMLALYDAFRAAVPVGTDEAALLHEDMVDRMVRIAQRNGYVHPSEARNCWKRYIPQPVKAVVKRVLRG